MLWVAYQENSNFVLIFFVYTASFKKILCFAIWLNFVFILWVFFYYVLFSQFLCAWPFLSFLFFLNDKGRVLTVRGRMVNDVQCISPTININSRQFIVNISRRYSSQLIIILSLASSPCWYPSYYIMLRAKFSENKIAIR